MSLDKFKQAAASLFTHKVNDELDVEIKPVTYLDTIEAVGGQIDAGAFAEFSGGGNKEELTEKLLANPAKYLDSVRTGLKLQDLYLVKGIVSPFKVCFDAETPEGELSFTVTKFKKVFTEVYGQDELDKLNLAIQKLSGVEQGQSKSLEGDTSEGLQSGEDLPSAAQPVN